MKTSTAYAILNIVNEFKIDALVSGRYDPPYTIAAYDNRDRKKAFRCIKYNRRVRQINALIDMFYEAVPEHGKRSK